jgi:hypothetical protein
MSEQDSDSRTGLIQALIPLALDKVYEELDREPTELTGRKHNRENGNSGYYWWGRQKGSIYLADQKLRIAIPKKIGDAASQASR